MPITDVEAHKLDIESRRWVNRRRMAWRAFYFSCFCTLAILTSAIIMWFNRDVETLKAVSDWSVILVGMLGGPWGVVMAYIGSSTYSDVKLHGKQ